MKMYYFIFFSGLFLTLSCEDKNEKLMQEYNKLYSLIKERNAKDIYNILDKESQDFVDFLSDTLNWEFEKIQKYGNSKDIELTTLAYYSYLKFLSDLEENDKDFIIDLFGITKVPLFSWFSEPQVLEAKSNGDSDQYVVIRYDFDKNSYVSSKVYLTKNNNGDYRINIFPLFMFSEKILRLQYNKFVRTQEMAGDSMTEELLSEKFFQGLLNSDPQFEKIRVIGRKKAKNRFEGLF